MDAERGIVGIDDRVLPLSAADVAVLLALAGGDGRVMSRTELSRRAGLVDRSPRRVDSVIGRLRSVLGTDAVRTVRRRGWVLEPAALDL